MIGRWCGANIATVFCTWYSLPHLSELLSSHLPQYKPIWFPLIHPDLLLPTGSVVLFLLYILLSCISLYTDCSLCGCSGVLVTLLFSIHCLFCDCMCPVPQVLIAVYCGICIYQLIHFVVYIQCILLALCLDRGVLHMSLHSSDDTSYLGHPYIVVSTTVASRAMSHHHVHVH